MLEQLTALLAASLGGGAAILVLLTLGPLLTRKVSPHWRYWAWAVVAVSLMAYPILPSRRRRRTPPPPRRRRQSTGSCGSRSRRG